MSGSAPYLKKAKNGKIYVHWTENRVGKRISTGTSDLAEAKAFFGQWLLMEYAAPEDTRGVGLTLADVWSVYEAKHVLPKLAGQYNAKLAWKQMQPHFGALPASGLSQVAIDNYLEKRISGKLGRKVKPQTVTKEVSYLVAAVRFCADQRRGLIDPSCIRKVTLPEAGEPRDRWLRTDEIQKLLDAAARLRRGDRLTRPERFLWLALETAGRKQALLDLTWDRVDFETNVIVLDVPGRRKTKKLRATVPISKALRPIMERAFAERQNNLVLDNKGAVWAPIQRVVIEAGLAGKQQKPAPGTKPKSTGISPHVLRHTAATHMARRGVPLWVIAKVLGNSIRMVEKVYAKHCPDDLREAVDLISGGVLEMSS
ncbi:site-specific integrase [Hoeflea sp. G2-23]|uniref:Site-specific integrase n=1 Tax=Hoeflea algicola TaxID=2983763 RepID=A0ABT3Z9D8_9HYPH|nr:site-specific integrase [Hoeflea algicola]MCY0148352.1 site-specific integrase [Hoeflea algicola]